MSTIAARVKAAVEDGRAQSPRFKQRQLAALHEVLKQNRTVITAAVEKDSQCSHSEASVQYYLTLDAVKRFYDHLDFDQMLRDEYSIAYSRDNLNRRTAIGCVNVIPDASTLLYSTVVPSAAAIAAGNCVVVDIKRTLSELGSLLRKVLPSALDGDTFGVVEKEIFEQDFKAKHCCVLDCSRQSTQSVVAVVDRSGDVRQAARDLVTARMSFAGRSRYAPDLVLVNDFCVEDFIKAVMQAALPYLASGTQDSHLGNNHTVASRKTKAENKIDVLKDTDASVLSSGDGGTILFTRDRKDKLLTTKFDEPLLLIHPISSLDDAIDFVNTSSTEPLQALYIFSAPPAAKYLSQFAKADISFTNHVPIEILVGPVAPRTTSPCMAYAVSLKTEIHPRFSHEMFSVPRPEYISNGYSAISEQLVTLMLDGKQQSTSTTNLSQATELNPLNEPQGGAKGFFEQGFIVGRSIFLSTILVSTATAVRYGYPYLMRLIRTSSAS